MEWVSKAKEILQSTCQFCNENRKIVSTGLLFLITFITLIIGLVLNIPPDVDRDSFKSPPPVLSSIKFSAFSVDFSQLQFLMSTCQYYACIEEKCYCKTSNKYTWQQAKDTCENSALPNAALFKPLQVKHGVFQTYKNFLTFLTNSGGYHRPMWTSLYRDEESRRRGNWLDEYNHITRFHLYDRQGDSNEEPYCVQKITSKGFALVDCSTSSKYSLPGEFIQDIYNARQADLDQLLWDDKYWNGVNVPNRILCELPFDITREWEEEKKNDLADYLQNVPHYQSGDKQYYIVSGTNRRYSGRKHRNLDNSGCYINHLNLQYDGRRAVINSKADEDFILDSIPEIFLEIGLTKELEDGQEVFKWDQDVNGMIPADLKWYYSPTVRSGLNCLSTQAYSQHDLQLNWEAAKCNEVLDTVCTFLVPNAKHEESVATQPKEARVIRNIYSSYFCLDENREKCFISVTLPFDEALHFARMNNMELAVISHDDKMKVAKNIRPQVGVYLGATSILRGKNMFTWMYTNQSVVFLTRNEKERLDNSDPWRDICLILASNGEYYPAVCDEGISTLIQVNKDMEFLTVEKGNFWY